jgi:signal transduction histidine kinase
MTTTSLEELLREALDRLRRQEERTAVLEEALIKTPPPIGAGNTIIAPWPMRVPAIRPAPPVAPATGDDRDELWARLAEAERRARDAEAALRGAMNLATAGRVAAGVAHDFHNLLSVIVGNADLLRESLPPDDPQREIAETIARTAQTVAGVSRKVLTVGRPGAPQVVPLAVSAALNALAPILRRLVSKAVALDFDLAPDLPLIRADATEFDRVVLNLVLNARDATSTGGSITVRAAVALVESRRFVALTVADTGCGMPAEVRKRIFELFFTTKGDRGTGLGLAMVRDALAAVGGHVEVESEVGWGTHVRAYWPVLRE